MGISDKTWHLHVGGSWVGTLTPTGSDDTWYYASFSQGDAWGNFAPWFEQAAKAQQAGDAGWQTTYDQLIAMGVTISADDGETYQNPTVLIDGGSAWFVV